MKKRLISIWVLFVLLFVPNISYGMHIMEGFLPLKWSLIWGGLSLPFLVIGFKRLGGRLKSQGDEKMLLGLVGGFVFLLSALKIPSVTGSCSHPTGVGLGAILFGPTIMTVIGVIVLLFQALLLAHGGLTTLGANTFSMAIVGPLVSYGIYKLLKGDRENPKLAIFLGSSIGNLLTYVVTSLQLGIAFPDAVNGITGSVIKFMSVFALTQIPLAIIEGIITVIVFNLILQYRKEGVLKIEGVI